MGPLRLKLPATSANLGPGFDALGLAMDFHLHVHATAADAFTIKASGRDAAQVAQIEHNLILETYQDVLAKHGTAAPALSLEAKNEIPLGMGCGSSAAALVAGVALANHFGRLGWTRDQVLTEASVREGHPDNVAACVLGGLTVSAMSTARAAPSVSAVSLTPSVAWKLIVAMPDTSLSTSKARALLPESYSRADAITNVQNAALLTAAFATGRGDLLAAAMQDRLHQPYRSSACPLLKVLLPLAGSDGVLGVALSGAGPSVLVVAEHGAKIDCMDEAIRKHAREAGLVATTLCTEIAAGAEIGC